MTVNRVSTCCPECGHAAFLIRQERHHRHHTRLHFACVSLFCGARFINDMTFSHVTRVSRSQPQIDFFSLMRPASVSVVPGGVV